MKIHIFSPHLRLIYAFLLSLLISTLSYFPLLLIGNAVMIGLFFYIRRKNLANSLKLWAKLNIFTLLLWLTLSWKIGAQGIELSPNGITLAQLMSLRLNLIMLSLWLLCGNLSQSQLLQAIRQLPLPNKLIYLFIFTVRYIAVFNELNKNMERAMRARGFQPKFNRRTLYVSAQRVALLLIHAMLKVEKTQMALKARAFRLEK